MKDIPIGVQTVIDYHGIKCYSIIRGFQVDKYILIDLPYLDGKPVSMKPNMDCIFRFVHEGYIYGFLAAVIDTIYKPYPLVFLRYPKEIETKNLRKEQRFQSRIECSFTIKEKKYQGIILDLSKRGCCLAAPHALGEAYLLSLDFVLPTQVAISDLKAEIKNSKETEDGVSLGLYFPEECRELGEFIELISISEE